MATDKRKKPDSVKVSEHKRLVEKVIYELTQTICTMVDTKTMRRVKGGKWVDDMLDRLNDLTVELL